MTAMGLNIQVVENCLNREIINTKMLKLIRYFSKERGLLEIANEQVATSFEKGILCYEYDKDRNIVMIHNYIITVIEKEPIL